MNKIYKSEEKFSLEIESLNQENEFLKNLFEQDITKHNTVQDALFSSEKRYRRLFETTKDGINIFDALREREISLRTWVNAFPVVMNIFPNV